MQESERIDRIKRMEEYFDILLEAVEQGDGDLTGKEEMLAELIGYYESSVWMEDFKADERGELPMDLKRGILSEDGIYNLLSDIEQQRGTV